MGDENGEKKKGVDGWKTKAIWATGGAVGITIAAPFVVGAIGFGATGITAGTWATTIMASYGGAVTKGSVCAILQSVGATGTLGTTGTIGSALLESLGWKKKVLCATLGAVGFTVAAPLVVGSIGFGTSGVAAGSTAAKIMASYGGIVTKGGLCASFQSVGATGTVGTAGTISSLMLGGGICGAAGVAGKKILSKFRKKNTVKSKL